MSQGIIEYSKILIKRTGLPGVVPTIPLDDNDLDSFRDTDILQGELYFNMADRILYTRANNEIVIIGGQGFDTTLLEELIGLVEGCCVSTEANFDNVFNILNMHSKYLQELIKCCRYIPPVRPTRPLIPGQAIVEIYSTESPTRPRKPSLPSAPINYNTKPKKYSKEPSKLILYPVDRGYFSIIGMPGNYSVQNRRIVREDGRDLEDFLPIYFNEIVCNTKQKALASWTAATGKNNRNYEDCVELVAIRGYVIKDTSQGKDIPFLIYETKKKGVTKTFEASTSLWYKYATNR